MELFGIYHANGGIIGELAYAFGKVTGRAKCELCDITHSIAWKKREWKNLVDKTGIDIKLIHLNEQSVKMRAFTSGKTPCVVYESEGNFHELLSKADLQNCHGKVNIFENVLVDSLKSISEFKKEPK